MIGLKSSNCWPVNNRKDLATQVENKLLFQYGYFQGAVLAVLKSSYSGLGGAKSLAQIPAPAGAWWR